ncbi:MAG: M42 family metallopeptidase [Candidatus Hodarchaeales archaeon]|jgi:putative aminopeptidase FrvX
MINKDEINLLMKLIDIPGPTGREELIQHFIHSEWEDLGLTTTFDNVGNLYGTINGEGDHWAVVAHADTIGFLVQQILPNGFLKMAFNTAATTPDARFLAGLSLKFVLDGKEIIGYFGLRSGHLAGIEGKKEPVLFDDMFVDIGVDSEKDVRALGIDIGTPAVFNSKAKIIQQNIVGPSMDNRIGLFIQILVAKTLVKAKISPKITFISTVQEEIGMKGAAAAARSADYDKVLNLDVGLTGDIPTSERDFLSSKIGSGPILVIKDFSAHYSHSLNTLIESTAKKNEIDIQKAVFRNYNTDGMYFFMQGYPTANIAVPCRYTHTNFETIRLIDVENTRNLVLKILTTLN